MKSPIRRGLLVVVTLVSVIGCSAPELTTGPWLFTQNSSDGESRTQALILLDGGQTQIPDPKPQEASSEFQSDFGGLAWAQDGSTFTLSYGVPDSVIYTGTVESPTSMTGTWAVPGASGTFPWSAVKL